MLVPLRSPESASSLYLQQRRRSGPLWIRAIIASVRLVQPLCFYPWQFCRSAAHCHRHCTWRAGVDSLCLLSVANRKHEGHAVFLGEHAATDVTSLDARRSSGNSRHHTGQPTDSEQSRCCEPNILASYPRIATTSSSRQDSCPLQTWSVSRPRMRSNERRVAVERTQVSTNSERSDGCSCWPFDFPCSYRNVSNTSVIHVDCLLLFALNSSLLNLSSLPLLEKRQYCATVSAVQINFCPATSWIEHVQFIISYLTIVWLRRVCWKDLISQTSALDIAADAGYTVCCLLHSVANLDIQIMYGLVCRSIILAERRVKKL